ncbi:ester cyclase [Novosphingobium resinovorum]|uniref:nuclear transport factor 2 family protein n=1 Tax=Novosphingobium resinovorum TaxID=158500 RepID=UPI002ED221F8|nr:nuclear transport factor 2 family protein [Novosphingobium resinovorum]
MASENSIPLSLALQNKQIVLDFYRNVFEAQNPDAIKDYVAEDYKQNNPHLPAGRSGLEELVRKIFEGKAPLPLSAVPHREPELVLAEGDLVVMAVCFPQPEPDDPSRTYPFFVFDAFRVQDGKISEHWSGINKIAPPKHLD